MFRRRSPFSSSSRMQTTRKSPMSRTQRGTTVAPTKATGPSAQQRAAQAQTNTTRKAAPGRMQSAQSQAENQRNLAQARKAAAGIKPTGARQMSAMQAQQAAMARRRNQKPSDTATNQRNLAAAQKRTPTRPTRGRGGRSRFSPR